MKKLFLTLVAAIAFCGSVFAQTSHWNFNYHAFQTNLTVGGYVKIGDNFIEVTDPYEQYEIAFFVDDVCRGTGFMDFWGDEHPIFEQGCFFTPPTLGEVVSFQMYDHANGILYKNGVPSREVVTGTMDDDYDNFLVITFPAAETRTLHVYGYEDGADAKEWNFIASPFDDVDPLSVSNMINTNAPDYDLYYFDQAGGTNEKEWRNYKQAAFNLASGTGYLYACRTGVDITFTGVPVTGPTKTVEIDYVDDAPNATSKGWNLVGNPFTDENAYIGRNFYTLNDAGTEINPVPSSGAIAPMTAVFVESAAGGETVTFSTENPGKGSELAINLTKDSKVIDRAIVRFDGNRNMRKFQLFENSTKLYIEQDNKDYAVVSAEAQGEMPLSFKAEKNGSYTLSLNTDNVEFGYLHLIDNLTGNEVDLLANPSYSFEATTSDYASRFRLVFATSDAANSQFAFVANGEILLTGQGNVKVYDVSGRLISSHDEVTRISTNGMSAGVYMLQLSNGSDVKTQKIVVK